MPEHRDEADRRVKRARENDGAEDDSGPIAETFSVK